MDLHKNGRREATRRYFLGNIQSEDMFIDCMRFRGYIFYVINVVGGVVNCKGVIYGGANVIALTRAF